MDSNKAENLSISSTKDSIIRSEMATRSTNDFKTSFKVIITTVL